MQPKHQDEEPPSSNVTLLRALQSRAVPPLTGDEILALRQMLEDFSKIASTCPVAKGALSKR